MAFQKFMMRAAPMRGYVAMALLVFTGACAALEVNTANEAELDSMRGLGPDSTARILKAREAGPFADWPDLMRRVKGIKQATAQKLSSQGLTVNGQALESLPKQAAPSATP
jgi:competence protein ComEA